MNKWAWWNPYLPQTLLVSVALTYFSLGATILFSGLLSILNPYVLLPTLFGLAGAVGIVNLRIWGYIMALISALSPFGIALFAILTFENYTFRDYLNQYIFSDRIISTVFQIAIVALLVHPMSTGYVKNNFSKKMF